MGQEPAVRGAGVGVEKPSLTPGKEKGVQVGRDAFAIEREVFAIGTMSAPARLLLRKRLRSELDAVRRVLRKVESFSSGAGATSAAAPAVREDGRFSAAAAPAGDDADASRAPKGRKVPPSVEQGAGEPKRTTTPDSRYRLVGRLAALAAALPDHVVAFLQNPSVRDADSRGDGDGGGGTEMDAQSMKDGGALFQLKMLLDKFAPESTAKNASAVSCVSRHQEAQAAGDRVAPVQEEEGVGVGVDIDICGGVSRIAIRDIAEEYGELVEGIDVQLLSPLQRRYIDLAEQDEYVDICGDASPVVFPSKAGDSSSSSPSSSSSNSDGSSSDSDSSSSSSSSSSDSDSEGDPNKSVSTQPPPAVLPKENDTSAQPPAPAPEAVKIAGPVATVHLATSSPPAPAAPPKENGTKPQPPEPAPEAEEGELQDEGAAAAAPVYPGASGQPAPPALPAENGNAYPQPPAEPAPAAVQIAEEGEILLQGEGAAAAPAPMNSLIARAQEAAERRRQKEKERAKAKARQELLKVERAALPDERIHPLDMELLGIAAFEHVVSTAVGGGRTARPQAMNGADLRVSPGHPSILQQLGFFLKTDDGDGDGDGERQQEVEVGAASDGEEMDMEIEDGEIR